jgi:AraC-like DNA-binding protein
MYGQPSNYIEKNHYSRIRKDLAFIQENLSFDTSREKMAEVENFSPFHLQKLFTPLNRLMVKW